MGKNDQPRVPKGKSTGGQWDGAKGGGGGGGASKESYAGTLAGADRKTVMKDLRSQGFKVVDRASDVVTYRKWERGKKGADVQIFKDGPSRVSLMNEMGSMRTDPIEFSTPKEASVAIGKVFAGKVTRKLHRIPPQGKRPYVRKGLKLKPKSQRMSTAMAKLTGAEAADQGKGFHKTSASGTGGVFVGRKKS